MRRAVLKSGPVAWPPGNGAPGALATSEGAWPTALLREWAGGGRLDGRRCKRALTLGTYSGRHLLCTGAALDLPGTELSRWTGTQVRRAKLEGFRRSESDCSARLNGVARPESDTDPGHW